MSKHENILSAIFARPTRANIKWVDIVSLFKHQGAEVINATGGSSRVKVVLNGVVGSFHRPHPHPDTPKGTLTSVRDFLEAAGVTP